MGLIGKILGLGQVAKDVSEVFVTNRTLVEEHAQARFDAAVEMAASETTSDHWFDQFVNALNRLPRPAMALGTIGLFAFAMIDPIAFSGRMHGLAYVPEPLWWLLGAVVSFYFGARELHYFRGDQTVKPAPRQSLTAPVDGNAALDEWRQIQGQGPDWLDVK